MIFQCLRIMVLLNLETKATAALTFFKLLSGRTLVKNHESNKWGKKVKKKKKKKRTLTHGKAQHEPCSYSTAKGFLSKFSNVMVVIN